MKRAAEVTNRCPACRDKVTTQEVAYVYAYAQLCDDHRKLWATADERAHRGAKLCPHHPKPCARCEEKVAKEQDADERAREISEEFGLPCPPPYSPRD